MIAKKSSLCLNEFVVLKSQIEYCVVESDDLEYLDVIKDKQLEYPIDIDYNIHEDADSKVVAVHVKVVVNEEEKPGYYVYAEGVGMFSFIEDEELDDKAKAELITYSGISMCITNLRSYIANVTSYYPFGKFSFPAIDMNDLIGQKINI
ncbi:hypothetical protein LJC44_03210 [Parabacteroides sp. OttesenSCG-928-G06]|nr:hypothetical protein [Parabacteroides sp. OttesenSCG-928-K15]MDL2282112.1 hypothetical protein [Parabacteroides sp. OttesenSCG-928-G06]